MIRVNLLKAEKKEFAEPGFGPEGEAPDKKAKEKAPGTKSKAPSGTLILVAALALLGGLAYMQMRTLDEERTMLADAQEQQARLQPVSAKLEEIDWQKQYLVKKIALIGELRHKQGAAVRVLDALSKAIPDWVWLTEASLAKTALTVRGRALTNVLISDYVRNLNQLGYFESVGIVSTQQRSESNSQFVEFTLTAVLPPPVPVAPPAGQPAAKPGRAQ